MISVVVETRDDEVGLALTLAALVPAAAEGFVRDVVVADQSASDASRLVADAAGCTVAEGGRTEALTLTRSEWVLVLRSGVRLEADWFREASAFVSREHRMGPAARAAAFRCTVDRLGWRARAAEVPLLLSRHRRAEAGLLAPREALRGGVRLRIAPLRARAFVPG